MEGDQKGEMLSCAVMAGIVTGTQKTNAWGERSAIIISNLMSINGRLILQKKAHVPSLGTASNVSAFCLPDNSRHHCTWQDLPGILPSVFTYWKYNYRISPSKRPRALAAHACKIGGGRLHGVPLWTVILTSCNRPPLNFLNHLYPLVLQADVLLDTCT